MLGILWRDDKFVGLPAKKVVLKAEEPVVSLMRASPRFARGGIDNGQTKRIVSQNKCCKKGLLVSVQQTFFVQASWCVDPGYDTFQEFRPRTWDVLLFCDGDLVAGSEHCAQVIVQTVPWKAGHRNWSFRVFVP